MKTLGLALGGGGARGLAHIVVLEAIDDLGIKPVALAGTSIGALIGACYAAGMSGRAIRRFALGLAHNPADVWRRLMSARAAPLASFLSAPFGNPVLVDAEKLVASFLPDEVPRTFAELRHPLVVIAADLASHREVIFTQGELRPALAASIAVPGLVRPMAVDGRVLVDGGAVDPLPFSQIKGRADVVLAVDCSAGPVDVRQIPDAWESVFATITVMGQTIVAEKLRHGAPDLLIRPNVGQFRLLEFFLASSILRAAESVKAEVRDRLVPLIGAGERSQ